MRTEFVGGIPAVRAIEDCVRATKKYTKGAFRSPVAHPVQGGDFPSRVLTEYYEIYPDLELDWDMDARDAWAWVWGDVAHIDVLFQYDYRTNRGRIIVRGNKEVVASLVTGVPGLGKALTRVTENGKNGKR